MIQFKLWQTVGSRGKDPFTPPRLLNDDPRDQVALFKPPPWSPEAQLCLLAHEEVDELSLKSG